MAKFDTTTIYCVSQKCFTLYFAIFLDISNVLAIMRKHNFKKGEFTLCLT